MQKKLRQLTPRETFFIGGETSSVYQHTGGLILLDAGETPDFNYQALRQRMEERLADVPQFRWKLHEVPLGLDLPYWVEDHQFDFDHHIRRIAVPSPGDSNSLGELATYLYSKHLDRNRPLWETWFIEGLPKGQFALVQKLHHCMIDGEGANHLGQLLNDFEPDAAPRPVDDEISQAQAGTRPAFWQQSLNAARRYYGLPGQLSREIYGAVSPRIRQRLSGKRGGKSKPPAPLAYFNTEITAHRDFVFGSLSLDAIKRVKNHFDVTVNDVVLAIVGGCLRKHLGERNKLPAQSLRSSIAVSLREDTDGEFSNRVTATNVTLATAMADPVERLRAIAAEGEQAKKKARGGATGFMEIMELLPPLLINAMINFAPPEKTAAMTGANLIVSNIRGSPWPMYMAGARMTAMYPMSIITPGTGINITCISYVDKIDFGIMLEPTLFPDPWPMIDDLQQALNDYMAMIPKPTRRTRRRKNK